MRPNYREILRLKSVGLNNTKIAESARVSRPTVVTALNRAAQQGIDWYSAENLTDRELSEKLFPSSTKVEFKKPDFEYMRRELLKSGVTLQLLWFEYCTKCREVGEIPYQLSQFRKYYREYNLQNSATMHISRTPGEIMEVDWAGKNAYIVDADTGEIHTVHVFVSVLAYSGYSYAEAFCDMKQESWITAHIHAYEFFGGVARILVPDNLKTGVTKHTRSELVINRTYQDLAEHYGTAVIPTRVRSPKDKASVESAVGNVSTFILAAIRNQKFFTLKELNQTIRERVHVFNNKSFQKKSGSRATLFADERKFLMPLPRNTFEMAKWKTATVPPNYHIENDGFYYSVPHELIGKPVEIRVTRNIIEVFNDGIRVCSHARNYDLKSAWRTDNDHLTANHRKYLNWNVDTIREQAVLVGKNTLSVIETILKSEKVEQQGIKACKSLLRLAEKYSPERLENACAKAFGYTSIPSFTTVNTILKSKNDIDTKTSKTVDQSIYGITRGAGYYGEGGGDDA